MSFDPETTRIVRSWLDEGVTQLPDRVLDSVLDQLPATPQRRATWWPARRLTPMNAALKVGLAAAVVVIAALIGINLLGTSPNVGGPGPDSSSAGQPTLTAPEATPTAEPTPIWSGIPAGPFDITGSDGSFDGARLRVTVDIASPGWTAMPELDYVYKNDDGLDAPQTVGGGLVAWAFPVGTEFLVYEDPCRWASAIPATPAITPEEIATAFLAQAETGAVNPVDITVGGYAGKAVTLTVPMSYEVPGATREEEFGDCDEDSFVFYGIVGEDAAVVRNAQGPGQIDELWIIDVEGSIVILDLVSSPATPADLVQEIRALAESAAFELR